ncbi:MAG TPA: site-2 protease family protein [Verrucomicrobiae bacterium]|nr:site-2 protease family protein [Verrucomicrobiae bacterium]
MLYKLVFRKFSFKELWLLTNKKPLTFFVTSVIKVFGGSFPCCSDVFNVESIAPLRCGEEAIPDFVKQVFQPIQAQLTALDFHSPVYYALWDGFHVNRIYRVEYAAPNGEGVARIHFRQWEKAQPPKKTTYVAFTSIFSDETMLVSSSSKWSTGPANVILNNLPEAAPEILWHSHLVKLHELQKNFYEITNTEAVMWAAEKSHTDFFNFYLKRGLFRPLSDVEQKSEATDRGTYIEMQSAGKQYPEILLEIKKLQEQKSPKWTRMAVILGLSVLLFVALGLKTWGRDYVLLLIPILLFHEAGHYLMMKIFGYRDLKMFFIPLFGAAVSGRHYNIAGWKKVVVSLMGPTPGIMLGALLGCVGIVLHNPFLEKFALLLLILNGFNLIPFIPLDGGWALQAMIFSRHYFFDVAFKVVAALAILGLSILLKTKSLMYVGIATLASLPVAISIAKATTKLRNQGFVAASPDDQNIPDAVAETIITELKARMPKAGTSKNMARMTLQVFENLNATPPSWPASLALLAWYGFTIMTAIVFAAVVFVVQTGLLGNLAVMPRLKYDCQSVTTAGHAEASGSNLNIVMTLDKPARAQETFNSFASQLREQESLEKIGQTLVLSVPAGNKQARQDWLERCESFSTNAFVDWTNNSASFSFICVAPDAVVASNMASELRLFFNLPRQGYYLVPPWARIDSRSSEQKAADDKARRTYERLISFNYADFDSPKLANLRKKMADARRHGDGEQLQDLTRQIAEATKQNREERFEKIRADKSLDEGIIELYQKREALPFTNLNARMDLTTQMAKQMGVAAKQNEPLTGAGIYSARTGYASSKGLFVNVNYVSFANAFEGAPAMLDWLCAKGCAGIRYSVTSVPYYGVEDQDD